MNRPEYERLLLPVRFQESQGNPSAGALLFLDSVLFRYKERHTLSLRTLRSSCAISVRMYLSASSV